MKIGPETQSSCANLIFYIRWLELAHDLFNLVHKIVGKNWFGLHNNTKCVTTTPKL